MVGDILIKSGSSKSSNSEPSKDGIDVKSSSLPGESDDQQPSTISSGNGYEGSSYRSMPDLTSPDIVDLDSGAV